MAQKTVPTDWTRDTRNILEHNYTELYSNYISAGLDAAEAREKAVKAVADAMSAKEIANVTREEMLAIIREQTQNGDLAPEIAQARGSESTLGGRLNSIDSNLAQKADDSQVRKKSVPIGLNDAGSDLLTAIQGGDGTPVEVLSIPRDDSVTMQKLAIAKKSTNLYNELETTQGYYVSTTSGNLIANSSFQVSGLISASPNTSYYVARTRHVAFYDENQGFISSITDGGYDHVFTTPTNAHFIRFSWESGTAVLARQQMNLGSVALPFEPYYNFIRNKYVERHPFVVDDVPNNSITHKKVAFVEDGKNLFDKDTVTVGKYVNDVTGGLSTNASYIASDYMVVEGMENIALNYHYRSAFYDEFQGFISGVNNLSNSGLSLPVPANAVYFRTTVTPGMLDGFQVEKGTVQSPYEPKGIKIPRLLSSTEYAHADEALVFLPNEINIAVGRTIELYNRQVVWTGNINNFHFQWVSNIGRSFKRKWSYTAESANIGTYDLTINVYDNNMKQVATASTIVNVVDSTIGTPFSLLTIGDSLTNNKPWLAELRTLSNNNISLVGTRGSADRMHEGRSGFRASSYLNATEYSFEGEGVHPFWDGARFNWNHYKTSTGVDPDAVQLFLGTNGINIDPTENANNIKQIVDYIRQDDATIPIFIVFTLYRGDQNGIGKQASNDGYSASRGQWKLEEDRKIFNLMVRLHELMKDYTSLHFVPVALTHDSEYNFGHVETAVNPRSTVKEPQPTEATHPQAEGYMQFADIMFSTMAAKLA